MSYEDDIKFGMGDGGIEFRAKGSMGILKEVVVVEKVPYDGTEPPSSEVTYTPPTFSANHIWHRRPA